MLKIKVAELVCRETNFGYKEALILWQSEYGELRKTAGCEKMENIEQAKKDAEDAKKIAMRLGIPEENIKTKTDMNIKDVNAYLTKELKNRLMK